MAWGPLTLERHRQLQQQGIYLRVFVRGDDVTDRCRYADDTPSTQVAELYRRTPSKFAHLDEDGGVAIEIATNDVEFIVQGVQ